MMQTLNPYTGTSTARTAEIMARYRPIAPRPLTSSSNGGSHDQSDSPGSGSGSPSSMSPTIRQSPYLRNVWPHLQSRPTRTRKRGRTSLGPPLAGGGAPSFKRPRSTLLQGLSPPFHVTTSPILVTLPLLPCSSLPDQHNMHHQPNNNNNVMIDINKVVPEEKDLLGQFQKPKPTVISPTPIRLIPSTVSIRSVKDSSSSSSLISLLKKKSEEIEKELESQFLPAFVSDSNNKVRLVNSAYKQMVGQPECSWLDSMVTADGLGVACKTICGEVVLNFMDQDEDVVVSSRSGFSCWTRIEWGVNVNGNNKKYLVNAFGEAIRLACESKDYKFAWRFHTRETSDPTVSM